MKYRKLTAEIYQNLLKDVPQEIISKEYKWRAALIADKAYWEAYYNGNLRANSKEASNKMLSHILLLKI